MDGIDDNGNVNDGDDDMVRAVFIDENSHKRTEIHSDLNTKPNGHQLTT